MSGYKIYIQKFGPGFIGDYAYAAYEGFDFRRSHPIFFFNEIEEVPKSKTNVVVGCIEDTIKYFERVGIPAPTPLNIPEELMGYCKRNVKITTMGNFKKSTELPIFVKPYERLKAFPSGVIRRQSSRSDLFNDVPDDFKVLTSEVIEMVSEYRGFVKRGKLVGLKQYIGDFRVFPDMRVIDECISKYVSAPSAYTIDFAVTDKGETVLIECNDGWSVGSYGLDGEIYADFLMTRWLEIMK
jgi:hypothetical protein